MHRSVPGVHADIRKAKCMIREAHWEMDPAKLHRGVDWLNQLNTELKDLDGKKSHKDLWVFL